MNHLNDQKIPYRTLFLTICLVLSTQSDVVAQLGPVVSHQKISNLEGLFEGQLNELDQFGSGMTHIGDLDDDGIPDVAVGAPGSDNLFVVDGNIWILFLNSDGTVREHSRISNLNSGPAFEALGRSGAWLAGLGDLDGDGVEDIAVSEHQRDDGGLNRGAVWILFLNTDGSVKAEQRISDTTGGFTGVLDDEDQFGSGISSIGDLDNDGVGDLLACSARDDDGGTNKGAAWVLFLNSDGTVKAHQKISDLFGGFGGTLRQSDYFCINATTLNDLDGNGTREIAVGSAFDDGPFPGATNFGGVWILFMNSDGTVADEQEITYNTGGLGPVLTGTDGFGGGLASFPDIDGDGNDELLVGAPNDDDGGSNRGAVWILYLNDNGAVKSTQKISSTEGGFSGSLTNNDFFSRVATLPDLNGDGYPDIIVGAGGDDDEIPAAGAAWILFLNESTLPVEMSSFSALAKDSSVLLEWTTLSEEGNAGFDVETMPLDRSAMEWESLGFVPGVGSSDQTQSYRFQTADLSPGMHAFRLRQIDFDGTSHLSNVVEIAIHSDDSFSLRQPYPNPFIESTTLSFLVDSTQPLRIDLFSAEGRLVKTIYNGIATENIPYTQVLDGSDLSAGLYLVRAQGKNFSKSIHILRH